MKSILSALTTLEPVYLALDIDGVLHHFMSGPRISDCRALAGGHISLDEFIARSNEDPMDPQSRLFDRAHILAEVLADAPHVRIVVASSWRLDFGVRDLQAVVPHAIAARIVGVLDPADDQDRMGPKPGVRGRLMDSWMGKHAAESPWLALDDEPLYWSEHVRQLVQTPRPGLDPETGERLTAAIRAVSSPMLLHIQSMLAVQDSA